jgi:succinate dehydrogenase / fumarate reductase cytochrome b subunit
MAEAVKQVVKRPISPHLTIYKPQIGSVLSILHRITGVINFLGIIAIIWVFVCSIYFSSENFNASVFAFYENFFGKLLLIAWSYSLFFHACNGVRYLFWDFGKGFDLKVMNMTGWAAVVVSALITTLCWTIVFLSN